MLSKTMYDNVVVDVIDDCMGVVSADAADARSREESFSCDARRRDDVMCFCSRFASSLVITYSS